MTGNLRTAATDTAVTKPARGRAGAGRRSGPGLKHEDKRTAILRTAAQLFAEKGYEATSLDNIAERLGMHKATLYHYVDNKESILYQCLVLSFGDLDEVIEKTKDRSIPVLERLRLYVRSLAVAQNNDFGRCLILVGSRPLEMTQGGDIRQFQRRLDATVRDLITEGIADGSIKPCDPSMFSALLFGALNWVPRWHSESGKLSVQQVADTFMDMVINGISATRR
ncbi:TetR/AcrR family transcriptional regulator [Variovorax sp. Sphag1AA]|uniref:TetR/AcrR family transcriptional regulator n=1 Tax=Variovorax sp. Sphag1AA TaxID=2587027 RepID=UPI00161F0B1A|nr:TetR/AcrR family transcriptional regulator [Variovorax sp. Sphag1AA]MBB3178515.1 AcrR family transcriptional regulator [Variovorax sp. Sphag1AA]